jgi:DNA-binding transcriptional ArsR family regulator
MFSNGNILVGTIAMDYKNIDEQATIFGVLADPTRLKLLRLLAQQKEQNALCVNALAYRLGVTQSAVSQHLRVLKSVGLVKGERRGYRIHYFINKEAIPHTQKQILAAFDFTEGNAEVTLKERQNNEG